MSFSEADSLLLPRFWQYPTKLQRIPGQNGDQCADIDRRGFEFIPVGASEIPKCNGDTRARERAAILREARHGLSGAVVMHSRWPGQSRGKTRHADSNSGFEGAESLMALNKICHGPEPLRNRGNDFTEAATLAHSPNESTHACTCRACKRAIQLLESKHRRVVTWTDTMTCLTFRSIGLNRLSPLVNSKNRSGMVSCGLIARL